MIEFWVKSVRKDLVVDMCNDCESIEIRKKRKDPTKSNFRNTAQDPFGCYIAWKHK